MTNTINLLAACVYMMLAAWDLFGAINSWREGKYGGFSVLCCLALLFTFQAAKVIFMGF